MHNIAEHFAGKRITVLGLGVHGGGVGVVSAFSEAGAKVTVTDIKTESQLELSINMLKSFHNVSYVLGENRPQDFEQADMVVISPAVQWTNPYVQRALQRHIPVEMDASIFFRFCPCPIIGVTGTKGKTTTSMLICEMLERAGKHVVRAGIGQISVLDKLKDVRPDSVCVFELSSWRLSSLGRMGASPHVAVFTNFLPDHLNYYGSIESYLDDKKNIFRFQKAGDIAIGNSDDPTVLRIFKESVARKIAYSFRRPFGSEYVLTENGSMRFFSTGTKEQIFATRTIPLKGKHNLANVMAASSVALSLGVDIRTIREAVFHFRGVAHRLELVTEKKGVKYYNDTAATIPEATISALDSFTQPVVLIAGGFDKKLEYGALAKKIVERTKDSVFFTGAASEILIEKIQDILHERGIQRSFEMVKNMEEAVYVASQKAQYGDIVLLSPGAASFGLFENEFDRGEQFRKAVLKNNER